MWSGKRLRNIQGTTRPDYLWRENVVQHVKGSSEEGEAGMNYWKNQKLNNARKLRDIYLIDLEDGEHKETIKTLGKFF